MVLKTLNMDCPTVEPAELKGDPHHLAPLIRQVCDYAKPERILDATAGSGATALVADERVIPCVTSDLNDPNEPVDLFARQESETYDLIVYQPDLWKSRPDATHPHDLGADMDWDDYVDLNVAALEHLTDLLKDGGHMLVVANTTRRSGRIYDLSRAMLELLPEPGQPVLVHPHPSCRSRGSMYGHKFVPIAHDPVLLWTKEELLGIPAVSSARGDE